VIQLALRASRRAEPGSGGGLFVGQLAVLYIRLVTVPRIEKYNLREINGIRWWRLVFAPFDFLIDPGLWITTRDSGSKTPA
jgi:hypothetical protein